MPHDYRRQKRRGAAFRYASYVDRRKRRPGLDGSAWLFRHAAGQTTGDARRRCHLQARSSCRLGRGPDRGSVYCLAAGGRPHAARARSGLSEMFGKRILILAAHPDDEVVACAATIGHAQARGAEIFTLYLTHGCIARDVMWFWQREKYETRVAHRRMEGEEAARLLGVTPVGWASRPARHLWR